MPLVRRPIPRVPTTKDKLREDFDEAVKERLEIFGGTRGERISLLDAATATTEQCALKLNELLRLLQP